MTLARLNTRKNFQNGNNPKFLLRLISKGAYSGAARMNPKRYSESLGDYGNVCAPFSANGFVLPRFIRLCPGFDNDCPEFWWGEHPREPRCPVPNPSRPALGKNCADLEIDCPGTKDTCPDSMSRRPGRIRFCPDAQTFAPFVIAAAPIYRTPRQFCNLLPVSNLYKTAPSPILSDTLPRRAGRGTG